MVEPLGRRSTVNPFKRDGPSGRLMKRVTRAISNSGGGGGVQPLNPGSISQSSMAIPSRRSSDSTASVPILPPLSPTLSMPPLSPCPSYRSSDSASSRSIPRKPPPEIDSSLLASPTPSTSSSSDETEEEQSNVHYPCEVVDGLWTSTCDERVDWPLPSWYTENPTDSPSPLLKPSRIARLAPNGFRKSSKTNPRRNFSNPPTPELDSLWLPTLLPEYSPSLSIESTFSNLEIGAQSPTFSTCSSGSFTSPSLSSSTGSSSSSRSESSQTNTTLSRPPAPDRKSFLRIESGGRQFIFNSSPYSQSGFVPQTDTIHD
ncbi:uncharacterized protein JCM6883_003711 [Sporobolomyces salmoneus]|uniref:uncharacterized protein n=1 Tax=Sporobolomyces salmoneus TaxID=183962 RepID=UPI0031718078